MNSILRFLLSFTLILVSAAAVPSQVQLTTTTNSALIDFETTVPGVNESAFDGSGFSPAPLAGQLNSAAWEILGFSDGDLIFGGTATSGDLARGTRAGTGTSTGGLYSLADFPASGGRSLAFQAGGTDFTPGSITLRIVNGDASDTITQLEISYDIYERNDEDRSSYMNFSYSSDNLNFTPLSKISHSTPELADAAPAYQKVGGPGPSRTAVILNTLIGPNGGSFYLRWESDDFSGTGSRDEIAIDNVSVTATFLGTTAASGSIEGTAKNDLGMPLAFVGISLAGSNGLPSRYALTNHFGRFRFVDIALGETYVLQASSGRFIFADPVVVVPASEKVTSVAFIGRPVKSP